MSFCPECRYEYIEGIEECPDCHVPLVPETGRELAVVAAPGFAFPPESGRELSLAGEEVGSTGRELTLSESQEECGESLAPGRVGGTGRELTPRAEEQEGHFCPECGYEYLPGVRECPDCRVALVVFLPAQEGLLGWGEWATVYETFEVGEAFLIRSLLEGSGFPVFIKNEQVGRAQFPLVIGGFQVQVPMDCVEAAWDLLQDSLA